MCMAYQKSAWRQALRKILPGSASLTSISMFLYQYSRDWRFRLDVKGFPTSVSAASQKRVAQREAGYQRMVLRIR